MRLDARWSPRVYCACAHLALRGSSQPVDCQLSRQTHAHADNRSFSRRTRPTVNASPCAPAVITTHYRRMEPQTSGQWSWTFLGAFLVVSLFLLVRSNQTLRFHSNFIIYVATFSMAGIVCIPLFCLNPWNVKNCLYISYPLRHVTKILGIEWEVRNKEILQEDRGAVIVANHQSSVDILGMFNFWEVMGKCAAVARKEIFYVWPFGLAAWLGGVVFIDRVDPSKANDQLKEAAQLMRRDKTKLWLFPEGTRNKKGDTLLPFKKGAFRVAITCQVPIIPVVFSPYYFLDEQKKIFETGKIIVTAVPAIPTEGLTMDDLDTLMEKTRNIMLDTYITVAKEVLSDTKLITGYNKLAGVKFE